MSTHAIRPQYEQHGAPEYFRKFGASYRNPHEAIVQTLLERASGQSKFDAAARVLDLACGSGEATLALRALGFHNIDGIDPYTGAAFKERTGEKAEDFSFEDIARGAIHSRRYDLCVCSFALHLAPLSVLPNLCVQLALTCEVLLVLTPHKRPHLKEEWGFMLREEMIMSRVRLRIYDSSLIVM